MPTKRYLKRGTTKLKESTRQRKHDEKLALMLGITLDEVRAFRAKEAADDKVREATAVQLFLERPDAFIQKNCKVCGALFLTTYEYVGDCSTHCRKVALQKVGITWNPSRLPEERWRRAMIPTGYQVPPQALEVLLQLAKDQEIAQESSECATDEQHEEIQYTEQSSNDSHIDPDELLRELAELEIPDFS